MNEELDPYAPPRADPLPSVAAAVEDSGSLWRVVDGRVQVRHMAKLPDIYLDGAPDDGFGRPHTQVMTRLPATLNGALWLPVGIAVLLGWLPLNGVVLFLFCVSNALQLVRIKEPRVSFLLRVPAPGAARWRAWLWPVFYFAAIGAAYYLSWNRGTSEAGGFINIFLLASGTMATLRLVVDKGFGHARKCGDGWFELKGIKPAFIARLEEIQQQRPPLKWLRELEQEETGETEC